MKNYPFIAGYRRFWYNLHALVDITTKEGTSTITDAIQRLEKMAADVGLSVLPAMAILPNVLTLWAVLKPTLGFGAALPLVMAIETLPFVLAYYVFRTDDNETLKKLLGAYYAIVFALTAAFKVFPPEGASLQSMAWLLLPCISVVAMLSYGKIRSMGHDASDVTPSAPPSAPEEIEDTALEPVVDVVAHPGPHQSIRKPVDVDAIASRRIQVKNLHLQGMSQRAIAKELGIGSTTVRRDLAS